MSGTVSTRWFWSDWISDTGVRASSLAARGLWSDLLAFAGMNKGRDYGYVLIAGKPPSNNDLAKLVGSTADEVGALLMELERNGVFSRDRRKVIYCRRMVRAEKNRINGRLGGNPNLINSKEIPDSVKAHIPEPSLFPEEATAAAPPVLDARTQLFRQGLETFVRISGIPADKARRILGRWLREADDDAVLVRRAIEDADTNRVADPVPWIERAIKTRRRPNGEASRQGSGEGRIGFGGISARIRGGGGTAH